MIACAANYSSAYDCCCQLQSPLGTVSSVVCNLHTECRPSGSGSPKSMYLTYSHKHLYIDISTSESMYIDTLYLYSFKFNTALLPPLLAMHVWVVQQNLVWTLVFLAEFYVCDGVCFHTQCRSCASGQVPKSEDLYPPWKVSILVFTTVAIFSMNSADLNIQCWVYSCWLCLL